MIQSGTRLPPATSEPSVLPPTSEAPVRVSPPARRVPPVPVLLVLLAAIPARSADPGAEPAEWDFVRETGPGQGLSTGEALEFRLLVAPERGLRVVLFQTGTDTTDAPTPGNDLDLEVVGPDGLLPGHAFPGEVLDGEGALPLEHVELAAADVSPGVWTVRVRGEWVPLGREGFRLAVQGDVREILSPAPEPLRADLAQNDPNPVRESTTIRFTLSRPGDILLAVYDIAGRPVRTLVSGSRAAGSHVVTWNARDASEDRVPPGIYFYRLECGDSDVTRKLVVIR